MKNTSLNHESNPKFIHGAKKLDYSAIPESAEIEWVKAHIEGERKYGYQNWRKAGVDARTYYAALRRHMSAFLRGESLDPDSGAHHLGHVMACAAIMLDASKSGSLKNNWDDAYVKSIPIDGKPSLRKSEHPSKSHPVDTSRINFALNNPGLPAPDTVKDGHVEAVGPDDTAAPVETLWRPVEGKYGRTRDGRKAGPFTVNCKVLFGDIEECGRTQERGWWPTGRHLMSRNLDIISEWVEPEATLTMREGAWYKRRDEMVVGPAERCTVSSANTWLVGGLSYTSDGNWFKGAPSDYDLIREVPAPDAPLDAQAIYDNNPADLVGSVWSHNLFLIQHSIVDFEFNYRNTSIPIVRYSDGVEKNGVWWSSFVSDHTLLRLASKEAAE